ncbi:MAG: UDP-N-acetylmuramoyl-L-alanine--D-glutamate ligase [Deinococcota bacterium]
MTLSPAHKSMSDKHVLVYGLGRSGRAVCKLLEVQSYAMTVIDARVATQQDASGEDQVLVRELGIEVYESLEMLEQFQPQLIQHIQTCIAAPGVPWQHADLTRLREHGVDTIGEVEWVYKTVIEPANTLSTNTSSKGTQQLKTIGITGTAGKTSTTQWVSSLLTQAGQCAPAGGNIGRALAEVVLDDAVQAEAEVTFVTEMSSFQLERCPTFRPHIAVILNLGVDHIDRHGSVEAYHAAKKNLLANLTAQDTFVYNLDDATLTCWASETSAKTLRFSTQNDRADAYYAGDTLMLAGEPLLTTDDLNVYGQHQHNNALAVALVGLASGLSRAEIKARLTSFTGVAGRYSQVATMNGVQFVEDSIATRTLAVQAALAATPAPIAWLAGGQDKGADLVPLRDLVRDKVSLLVAIGEAGPKFADAFRDITDVCVVDDADGVAALARACATGYDHLTTQSKTLQSEQASGTVLLAPLAASFDQFPDYQARAKAFRQVVTALVAKYDATVNASAITSTAESLASETVSLSTASNEVESNVTAELTSVHTEDASTTPSHNIEEPAWTVS